MPFHIANYTLSFYFHILMNVSTYFVESFTCFCILLCVIISMATYVLYEKVQYIMFKGRVKVVLTERLRGFSILRFTILSHKFYDIYFGSHRSVISNLTKFSINEASRKLSYCNRQGIDVLLMEFPCGFMPLP